ncbi:hypothetical protein SPRG_18269 [Saprolegnia parasitica CBS 223.65]|uniref:Uncharacterized protein n=1 Tax=Saprolegnia parasitica (strain CBS 223.65) TaxID=695850 RepID=A0A067BCZ7_SAPPC|nr:hypothetical protein SPRG_18269 [Saprolegnia parasitica CBS 223.65]KDO16199.1 hypothetical protein SPRG_18269 [Saprolegnia parasitica CBS 223.65]|eukprot:XP_012213095.1 hypothetical protein SPRG_18269 [Saprolegnia parasitica CBS 223.65]
MKRYMRQSLAPTRSDKQIENLVQAVSKMDVNVAIVRPANEGLLSPEEAAGKAVVLHNLTSTKETTNSSPDILGAMLEERGIPIVDGYITLTDDFNLQDVTSMLEAARLKVLCNRVRDIMYEHLIIHVGRVTSIVPLPTSFAALLDVVNAIRPDQDRVWFDSSAQPRYLIHSELSYQYFVMSRRREVYLD